MSFFSARGRTQVRNSENTRGQGKGRESARRDVARREPPTNYNAADHASSLMHGVATTSLESLRAAVPQRLHAAAARYALPGASALLPAAVRELMEGAVKLNVPLTVDVGIAENWKDAKS